MKRFINRRPSPAMIVALAALIVAMSGAAIAAKKIGSKQIKKNAVHSKHIKKNNVKSKQIAKGAVKGSDIAKGAVKRAKVAGDAINGSKVEDGSLSSADLDDYNLFAEQPVKVTATPGVDLATARAAAPETPLFEAGSIDVYGKCLFDTTAGEIWGETYVRTSANGAMMEGDDDLPGANGTEFLDIATLEVDRQLDTQSATVANTASYNEAEGLIMPAEGDRAWNILTGIGAKQGAPVGGNGPFGAGDVCLFHAALMG